MKNNSAIHPTPKGVGFPHLIVTYDDAICINGVRVIQGSKGLFVAMPQQQVATNENNNGEKKKEYKDIAFPISAELRKEINETTVEAYKQELNKMISAAMSQTVSHDETVNHGKEDFEDIFEQE